MKEKKRPGPKSKKIQSPPERKALADVLNLASAVSSLRLSPVAKKEKPKKNRATNSDKQEPTPTPKDTAKTVSKTKKKLQFTDADEGDEEEPGDLFDDDVLIDSDEEINREDRVREQDNPSKKQRRAKRSKGCDLQKQNANKKKSTASRKAEPEKSPMPKAKAKAKAQAKAKATESAGTEEKPKRTNVMTSYLAKQWLTFRKEQLAEMKVEKPGLTYKEAMKEIAERPKP